MKGEALIVIIQSAQTLLNQDIMGISDPFALVSLTSKPWDERSTSVIDNDLDPVWNEKFYFFKSNNENFGELLIKLKDKDSLTNDDSLGSAKLDIDSLNYDENHKFSLPLILDSGKLHGNINLEIQKTKALFPRPHLKEIPKEIPPSTSVQPVISNLENLVLEGGGVKGIVYAGAFEILEKEGILKNLKKVAGTSAGSMAALGLALGGSPQLLEKIIVSLNFNNLKDFNIHFLSVFGLYKGEKLSEFIKQQIVGILKEKEKEGTNLMEGLKTDQDKENITFSTLHQLVLSQKNPSSNNFRDLCVIGTNLTRQIAEKFDYLTAPDMPLWLAVRISMGIPVFFVPVEYNGCIYCDGGLSLNYPIDIFDCEREYNVKTFGLAVQTPSQLANDCLLPSTSLSSTSAMSKAYQENKTTETLPKFLGSIVNFLLKAANQSNLHPIDQARTILIDTGGVDTTDFNLSEEQKQGLLQNGRDWTQDFLNCWSMQNTKL